MLLFTISVCISISISIAVVVVVVVLVLVVVVLGDETVMVEVTVVVGLHYRTVWLLLSAGYLVCVSLYHGGNHISFVRYIDSFDAQGR